MRECPSYRSRICGLKLVWAQQSRDHVAGDHQGADGVEQLDDHGSNPPQRGGVKAVERQDREARADVDEVEHVDPSPLSARDSPPSQYPARRDQNSTGKNELGHKNSVKS
jgi:hypothetical protein